MDISSKQIIQSANQGNDVGKSITQQDKITTEKSGSFLVQSPQINLPKGGGAIKSIDEKFTVNAVNGTAACGIPLPVSIARGFSPAIGLSYNSGAGNGVFGLGWSLNVPSIKRKTEKELPQYFDAIDSDTYIISEAEDLVPEFRKDKARNFVKDLNGHCILNEFDSPDTRFLIRRYRPRVEGLFSRLERWTEKLTGYIHWRVTSKDNVTSLYGQDPKARIADPGRDKNIFEWLLQFTYDDKGNCAVYEYKTEDATGISIRSLHNKNRLNGNAPFSNTYLKRVRYGNVSPYKNHEDPIPSQFMFETVFDYGEHDDFGIPFNENGSWDFRQDAFSDYRAGFEIRTCRLCRRVLLYHHFNELPGGSALIKSLQVAYTNNGDDGFTFLQGATITAYTKHDDGTYTQKSFPPFNFSYQPHAWNTTVKTIAPDEIVNAPSGIDNINYQLVDLYSEGLSGILTEQAGSWFYKNNLGGGKFAPARLVMSKPSFNGLQNNLLLTELEANGIKQIAGWHNEPKGFFELSDNEEWQPFVPFESVPNINFSDPNTRMIDLNGDGIADLLVTEQDAFTWYPSQGKKGFAESKRVPGFPDEEISPAVILTDTIQTIFLADMCGDGLTDIVRIRNGEVSYWPNLGYGKFGAKIDMDEAPLFDHDEQFNPLLLKLADIDGSGTTDIVYFGKNQCRIWLNQQGNAFFQEPKRIPYFPETDNLAKINITDLLGTGLGCITWSSAVSKNQASPLRYIDLMNSVKPHILISYKNNLGKEVELEYIPSGKFYINDKLNGTPWVTKLHFPVHCVSKIVTYDRIMKTRFASEYSYHHGYYDHLEREFRGFGRVDQQDAEDITHFTSQGLNAVIEKDLQQPPVLTKTWFHTGAFLNEQKILHQFAHEYFQNPVVPENFLPDTALPPGLSAEECRQAMRACKGIMLRKEIYALDGSVLENNPYAVEQHSCLVKILQPKEINKYGIFLANETEAITWHYERDPNDPRIIHSFIFDIDDYGNTLQQANVAYGRKPMAGNEPEQETTHISFTGNEFTNDIQEELDYRAPLPYLSRSYEVTGITAPPGYFQLADLKGDCMAATFIDYDMQPGLEKQKRLTRFSRIQYLGNDGTAVMPLGTMESKALQHQSQQAAFSKAMLVIFDSKISPAALEPILADPAKGAYIFMDNYYWLLSGTQQYDVDHFFLSTRFTDPFGNITNIEYDNDYFLFIKKATDPLGNEVVANKFNYRVLAPSLIRDMNDNLYAVRFDELGLVVKTFAIGKKGLDPGDEFDDTKLEINDAIDFPGSEMEYSISEWYDQTQSPGFDITGYKPHPNFIKTTTRETHYHAEAQHQSKFRESYAYCDGSGQFVLTKTQAEAGAALQVNPDGTVTNIPDTSPNLRWVGSGRTILNNKGNPIKEYEPYFNVSPSFDDEKEMVELGVTPVTHYDPTGRVVRTDLPNKTFSKVEFNAWQQISYDNNDTIRDSEWYAGLGSPDPAGPEPADKNSRSAWLAAKHANTPAVLQMDSLGRAFLSIADNGPEKLTSRIKYDIEGKELEIRDALNRKVMSYDYNMAGVKWKQTGLDAGSRWMIIDVAGKGLFSWDEREHEFSFIYDQLGRITKSFTKEGQANPFIHAQVEYGETVPTAKADNLRGKAYKNYDQSGLAVNKKYDFKGNQLQETKQLAANYKTIIDWTNPVALETEIFESSTEYDALNRPVRTITPHSANMPASETIPSYNEAGLLNKVDARLRDAANITSFITNINYNSKGQREEIFYGNNTSTKYSYDKETFRLIRLLSTRNAGANILQDLDYTYDPVGNITQIKDNAQPDIFFDGEQVQALNQYEYDALYRLITATGRKHAGQTDIRPKSNTPANGTVHNHPFINSNSINPNDANAFRNYREQYQFDKAGNIEQQQHIAKNSSWTRTFVYDNGNNLHNRLTTCTIGPDSYNYSYDAHGNMNGLETLMNEVWDFVDHFRQAGLGGGGTVYYVYDNSGQRNRKVIERQDGSISERIYLGGTELYREKNNSGAVVMERETLQVMDGQQRVAMVDTPVVKPAGNNQTQLIRYQYENHLGSASMELDDAAKIISYEEYFPYGTSSWYTIDATREVPAKRYRYTGKERDEETGLNYHGVRYYAMWLCRWTAADPLGIEDGLNTYLYVSNNPVLKIDPTGTQSKKATKPSKKLPGKIGLVETIRQEMLAEDRKARANARSVILDSGKKDDFTRWGQQFVQKDKSKREMVAYNPKKTVVENYEEAAKKTGPKGTLIVSVGHGADQHSCTAGACNVMDPSIGSIDLTPDGRVKVDNDLFDYLDRGEMAKRSDDTLLKRSKDKKELAKFDKGDRFRLSKIEKMEARLQQFLKIGKALRDAKVDKVVFISCRVGNSTVFIQHIADTWGVDIVGYEHRIGANEENGKAYLSAYGPKELGTKEIDPSRRVQDEVPTLGMVTIKHAKGKFLNPASP